MKKVKHLINKLSVGLSGLLAVPYGKQLERFFSNIIDETPTVYDKAISKLEDRDPKWLKAALLESFLLANCGKYGEKITLSTTSTIHAWIRENLSDKEFKQFEKKFGL